MPFAIPNVGRHQMVMVKPNFLRCLCFSIFFYPFFTVDRDTSTFVNSEYMICFKIDLRIFEIFGLKVRSDSLRSSFVRVVELCQVDPPGFNPRVDSKTS